jgi:hypothetical protein
MPHTPGPWQFYDLRPHDDGLGYIRPLPEDGLEIAHHGDSGRSREENLANAALIAAAPDLLAALKMFLAFDSEAYDRKSHRAKALIETKKSAWRTIAKAEGA